MTDDRSLKFIVREGPNLGESYLITQDQIIIGRSEQAADFVIPFHAVSSRHASLTREQDRWVLEDLQSSNGTFVNGDRLTTGRELKDGDMVQLGLSVRLEFSAPPLFDRTFIETAPHELDDKTSIERAPIIEPPAAPPLRQPAQPTPPPPPTPPPSYAPPPGRPAETMLFTGDIAPRTKEPSRLHITIAGEAAEVYTLTAPEITLGRHQQNDIIIPSAIVSRQFARLTRDQEGYLLTVLPEVGNPLLFEGRPVTGSHRLQHQDMFRIGGESPGMMVTIRYESAAEAQRSKAATIDLSEKGMVTIGRDPSNDIHLDDPLASRFHAQIERIGQRFRVTDLRSSNGTFVNANAIDGERWLQAEDIVRIGNYGFVVGQDVLTQYDESSNLRIEATGLNKWVRKDLNILQDISLVIQPREFIVVVGQSGGGKSTLVDAIAGYRPATHGEVVVNGVNVYKKFDAVRHLVGYVPQKDIIHMELTVYQALNYAARLRMPADTSKAERHQRILEVLEDLDLTHRKDVQISGLSGGQQKRVSIGVELLTKPGLFYLDEPTSGLDPGTETALMQLMRRLADQGRTITLITHATKNVMLADKVVFLARGGYLTWFGPPEEALVYFDQFRSDRERRASEIAFDDIYAILDDDAHGTAAEWAARYQQHPAYDKYITSQLLADGKKPSAAVTSTQTTAAKPRQVSGLRQFFTLSGRNIRILTRDRFSLGLMLAAAPLVSLLDVILANVLGNDPFNYVTGNMTEVLITYFLLAVYGVMVGGLAQMREIVKERDIYRRERLVNLKILPYILSKIWVAGLLALYQALVYTAVHYFAFEIAGGWLEFVLIYFTLALATMAGMMLGLFASALAPSPNSAPLIVILLMLPQIVLGGVLVPMPVNIAAVTSTHWAFDGFMTVLGLGNDLVNDVCWSLPAEQLSLMSIDQKDELCRCRGTNTVRQETCDIPGVGAFYNPAMDQPRPVEPPPLRTEPVPPEVRPQPVEPADQSDQVALAEYLDELKIWQAEAGEIQAGYEAEVAGYRADAEIFRASMVEYQSNLAAWQIARTGSSEAAEGMIAVFNRDVPWAFANKENPTAWWNELYRVWGAQLLIIGILFVAIIGLQKRKDGK